MSEQRVACKACERWSRIDVPNPGYCSLLGRDIISGDGLDSCGSYIPKAPSLPAGTVVAWTDLQEVLSQLKELRQELAAIEKRMDDSIVKRETSATAGEDS